MIVYADQFDALRIISVAPGVDEDAEAARLVPAGKPYIITTPDALPAPHWYAAATLSADGTVTVDLPNAIALTVDAIDARARADRDAIVAGTSPAEMASWPIKRQEALAYTASGDPADAPMLSAEAAARRIALDALVTIVANKSLALGGAEAAIAGKYGRLSDEAKVAQSLADLDAVMAQLDA